MCLLHDTYTTKSYQICRMVKFTLLLESLFNLGPNSSPLPGHLKIHIVSAFVTRYLLTSKLNYQECSKEEEKPIFCINRFSGTRVMWNRIILACLSLLMRPIDRMKSASLCTRKRNTQDLFNSGLSNWYAMGCMQPETIPPGHCCLPSVPAGVSSLPLYPPASASSLCPRGKFSLSCQGSL